MGFSGGGAFSAAASGVSGLAGLGFLGFSFPCGGAGLAFDLCLSLSLSLSADCFAIELTLVCSEFQEPGGTMMGWVKPTGQTPWHSVGFTHPTGPNDPEAIARNRRLGRDVTGHDSGISLIRGGIG